jgi:hypothetical protein
VADIIVVASMSATDVVSSSVSAILRSDVVECSDSDDDSVTDWLRRVVTVSPVDFSVLSDPWRSLAVGSSSVVVPGSNSVSESAGGVDECSVPWSDPDSFASGSSSVSVGSVEAGVPDPVEPLCSEVPWFVSSSSVSSVVVDEFSGSAEVLDGSPAVEPAAAPGTDAAGDPVVELDGVVEPEVVEVVEPEVVEVVEPEVVEVVESAVVEVVDFEVVSEDGAVAVVFVSEGSANAIPGVVATAIPTPSANANGPTRPMNFPGFI